MLDIVIGVVLVAFAAYGWRRGAVGMAFAAVGLFSAYVAALLLSQPLGGWINTRFSFPSLFSYALAGMAIFMVASALVRGLGRRQRRKRRERLKEDWIPPAWDRWGGAGLGVLYGLGIAIFFGWAAGALLAERESGALIRKSLVGRASAPLMEKTVYLVARPVLGDRLVSDYLAHAVTDPVGTREATQTLANDERVRALLADVGVKRAIKSGDAGALAQEPLISALAGDDTFVRAARRVGLISQAKGSLTPEALAADLAQRTGPILRTVDALRSDSQVQAMLEDRRLQEAVQGGNFLKVVSDPRFSDLFERFRTELRNQQSPGG